MGIREDVLDQPVAPLRLQIDEAVEDTIPFRVFDLAIQVALFFTAKRFAIADQESKIARVRPVNG